MYSLDELAVDLEQLPSIGYDVNRISKLAYQIYQSHGLEATAAVDRILLTLMTMIEGEEFELTENEFLNLINGTKSIDSRRQHKTS